MSSVWYLNLTKELDRNSILRKVVPRQAEVVLDVVTKGGPTFVPGEILVLAKPGLDTGEGLARDDSWALLSPGTAGEVDLLTVEKILRSRGGGGCCSNFFVEVIILLGLEESREREEWQSLLFSSV